VNEVHVLDRYTALLRETVARRVTGGRVVGARTPMEAALAFGVVLVDGPEKIAGRIGAPGAETGPAAGLADVLGHRRTEYRGLVAYAIGQVAGLVRGYLTARDWSQWERGLAAWAEVLSEPQGGGVGSIAARDGAAAAGRAWDALARFAIGRALGRESMAHRAGAALRGLAKRQTGAGPFLLATASDNPEAHWYHELVILHALASYAAQGHDEAVWAAVRRNAAFHLNETQPDHATNQPWGLIAFVGDPATRPIADGMLHAASALAGATGGEARSAVTSILLADALYCLLQ